MKDHEGFEYIEASPLKGMSSGWIRVVKASAGSIDNTWASVYIEQLGKHYVSHPDWYRTAWGFNNDDFTNALKTPGNSSSILGQLLIQRVQNVSDKFLALKPAAEWIFRGRIGWQEPLFRMVRHLQILLPCLAQFPQNHGLAYVSKARHHAEQPFNWSSYNLTRVYIHAKVAALKYGSPLVQHRTGIEFTTHSPVVRIKPIKNAEPGEQCSFVYQKVLALFKTLVHASQIGVDLTGLCVPLDVLEFPDPKNKSQIIVPYPHQSLAERLGTPNLHPQERLKIAYQITKGLHTLHVEFRCALLALEPETIVFGANGKVHISDFTRLQKLGSRIDIPTLHTFKVLPPEAIIHSNQDGFPSKPSSNDMLKKWDSWHLGWILWAVATSQFIDCSLIHTNPRGFIEQLDRFLKQHNDACSQTLEFVSLSLMKIDPEERMSVSEALSLIMSFGQGLANSGIQS